MLMDLLLAWATWAINLQAEMLEAAWPAGLSEAVNQTVLGPGLGAFYALCYFDKWFPVSETTTVVAVTLGLGLFMVLYRLGRWAIEVLPFT